MVRIASSLELKELGRSTLHNGQDRASLGLRGLATLHDGQDSRVTGA